MHATGLWITDHGLQKLQRERAGLRDWLGHIKLDAQRVVNGHKKNKQIALILFENEAAANRPRHEGVASRQASVLPSVWEPRR